MPTESNTESFTLRTALRELVALSAIPAAWVGRESPTIAAGLADVLVGSLHLDFAFVRLCDPKGGSAIEVMRGYAWKEFPEWLQTHPGFVGRFSSKAVSTDPDGPEACTGVVIPIGVNAEAGLVAGACNRTEFPNEIEQLLFSVAANHAAAAFQSARIAESVKAAAVAEERNRLARDIHDTLAQALALMVMQLQHAESKLGSAWASAREPLETVRQLAVEGLVQARRSVGMLRPPVTPHGLPHAVHETADLVRRYYRGCLDVRVTGVPHVIERSVEEELFAIVREALTNAARHSRGTRIDVRLAYLDQRCVRVAVADDGEGFDPEQRPAGRYGLVGMYERANRIGAALTLVAEPGAGTELVVVWPNE
jgi:signal transduction histidine kinase